MHGKQIDWLDRELVADIERGLEEINDRANLTLQELKRVHDVRARLAEPHFHYEVSFDVTGQPVVTFGDLDLAVLNPIASAPEVA